MMGRNVWVKLMIFINLVSQIPAWAGDQKIEVHGHRGTRGLLPENTLPSFKSAMDAGSDLLEMDLAVTSDGVIVVSHDPFINPKLCLNPDGSPVTEFILIHSIPLEQVKQYDCGTLVNQDFPRQKPVPGAKIPTLDEVFELVQGSNVGLNLEIKIYFENPEYTVSPEEFAAKVTEAVQKSGLGERIQVQSFDPRPLEKIKELDPTIRIAFLAEMSQLELIGKLKGFPQTTQFPERLMIAIGKQIGAEIIAPYYQLLNQERIQVIQKSGFRVIPWTVNEPEGWRRLIEMGVNGIITDYPADLVQFLKQYH